VIGSLSKRLSSTAGSNGPEEPELPERDLDGHLPRSCRAHEDDLGLRDLLDHLGFDPLARLSPPKEDMGVE
jgi:hypothetical protein